MDDIFLIHMPDTSDSNEVKEWFDSSDQMHEFLCGTRYAYAHECGQIRDHTGATIGKWINAQLRD